MVEKIEFVCGEGVLNLYDSQEINESRVFTVTNEIQEHIGTETLTRYQMDADAIGCEVTKGHIPAS